MEPLPPTSLKWSVCESLVCELDLLLYLLFGKKATNYYATLFGQTEPLTQQLEEQKQALLAFIPESQLKAPWFYRFALALDLIYETNYQKLSLQLRKHTFAEMLEKQITWFDSIKRPYEPPFTHEMTWEQVIEEQRSNFVKVFQIDKEVSSFRPYFPDERTLEVAFLSKIFRGGELEYEFWHWMDRMYYEFYGPWRESRQHEIDRQKEDALQHLEALEGIGVPSLKWLEGRQPLLSRSETREGLQHWFDTLHFVTTPFRMGDFSCEWHTYMGLSLADNAFQKSEFQEQIADIATLTRAISDPTRLLILHCIRNIGLYTTELASFLGISRPTVSEHCKILRNAGLIETYQVGRKSFHKLQPKTVRKMFRELETLFELPPSDKP